MATSSFIESWLDERVTCLREEISILSELTHLHECFTLLRRCSSACKVTHLMRIISPRKLSRFLNGFHSELKQATEKILIHNLSDNMWLTCLLLAKYGGLKLGSGKVMAEAQYAMSLRKCEPDMATHSEG